MKVGDARQYIALRGPKGFHGQGLDHVQRLGAGTVSTCHVGLTRHRRKWLCSCGTKSRQRRPRAVFHSRPKMFPCCMYRLCNLQHFPFLGCGECNSWQSDDTHENLSAAQRSRAARTGEKAATF